MIAKDDPLLAAILGNGDRRMPLAIGKPNEPMRPLLMKIMHLPAAVQAGLWLYHDFFDEAHALSDSQETPDAYFWHAILHRREPDAGNAKYWFRKVGHHAIFPALAAEAHRINELFSKSTWQPEHFVDLAEQHRGTGDALEAKLEQIQLVEWRLLMDHVLSTAR